LASAGSTVPEDGSRLRIASIWAAPLAVLFGIWLWLAFSSGGYLPRQWLPPSLALGLFGLVIALLGAYPRRPRQLSLAVLALFGSYALWVAISAIWAESTTRVWMEAGRTFGYLLVLALALVYLTDPAARRAFRYLLMAAGFILLLVCVWRLWSGGDVTGLFIENRLSYPVSYPNNAAALFLIAFWPLMWLAAGPKERAPVRGVALGLATGLLGLAIMTQSRGAIWSLAITLVLMFVVSPARIRTLFYLIVPALLLVYEFPHLNRYWLEGPDAVGGGLGARTILVASITAAFIGTILALLERWVRVSRRMKAIFGTVILLGTVAAIVYGSIALTSDAGGPFKWVSQTWRQFTGQARSSSESESTTRLTIVSSSGRVEIWKVAWKEFQGAPVLGVGADNFVFQYDRLRPTETFKPQQAHSIELQVLGETGIVGGIFAFGGMLLALGGMLWPRCTAGWRGARETWLQRRRSATSASSGASPGLCSPRWGKDSSVYGWEIAVLLAVAYWLIHASVDWLWQMAGVSIPALLLLAAGVASVDARADVMWPRLNRRLWMRPPISEPRDADIPQEEPAGDAASQPSTTAAPADQSDRADSLLMIARRSDQYVAKQRRRTRRRTRKQRNADLMRPPGVLSLTFRALLVTLSLVVIVTAGLPYLSLQYQKSALALARTDSVRAVGRAGAARWLQPSDPGPYLTQAAIYSAAASAAATSSAADRAGAVLDNLALTIDRLERATTNEPGDWSLRYRAGVTALNLLLASQYADGLAPELDYAALIPLVPGLEDWSALAGSRAATPGPGLAARSLAASASARETATRYRSLSQEELSQLALQLLEAAKERNPLASQIDEATQIVVKIRGL
jgi:hypothetical protein